MKKYILLSVAVLIIAIAQPVEARGTFVIQKGWNLISTQVVDNLQQDKNRSDELFQSGAGLFILNPENKKYYGSSSSFDEVLQNLKKTFEALGDEGGYAMGWWFYSPRMLSLSIDFDIPQGSENYYKKSYHLRPGWNLVGITSIMIGSSLKDIAGSCSYSAVYVFGEGNWIKFSEGAIESKFIETGKSGKLGDALAIKVPVDCQFSFSKQISVPQVPNLPE